MAHAHAGALTGNLKIWFFHDGKAAQNCMFCCMGFFLIISVFPHFLEKNRATSTPESRTHLFSIGRRDLSSIQYEGWGTIDYERTFVIVRARQDSKAARE